MSWVLCRYAASDLKPSAISAIIQAAKAAKMAGEITTIVKEQTVYTQSMRDQFAQGNLSAADIPSQAWDKHDYMNAINHCMTGCKIARQFGQKDKDWTWQVMECHEKGPLSDYSKGDLSESDRSDLIRDIMNNVRAIDTAAFGDYANLEVAPANTCEDNCKALQKYERLFGEPEATVVFETYRDTMATLLNPDNLELAAWRDVVKQMPLSKPRK